MQYSSFSTLVLLATTLTLALSPQHACGANQYFMPGDAFFHTVLTAEVAARLEQDHNPVFEYVRPDFLPRMFCGYAGFKHLQYDQMPEGFKQNLVKLYGDLRKTIPKRIEILPPEKEGRPEVEREINGFNVLFYHRQFDRKKFKVGLKYNEGWVEALTAFGHSRDHAKLESFVFTAEAIIADWRDARLVDPLPVEAPESTTKNFKVPLRVKAPLVAIVVPDGDFKNAYEGGTGFWGKTATFVVTEEGISQLRPANDSENGFAPKGEDESPF